MNVLVTGGTGFVGRELVRRLLREGNNVGVLARDEKKLALSLREKVKMYKADISDLAALEDSFSLLGSIDVIFHLAACIDYNASREKMFRINAEGTLNLLNLAVRYGIKKFVFASSIEAIGPIEERDIPADETQVCQPVNSYGESKLEAEKQVLRFGGEGKIDVVVLRLGNVYGPGSLSFISPVSSAILGKNKKWLYCNQDRFGWHPVYIDDVIDGVIKAAAKKGINDVYILTGAERVTLRVLSQLISQEMGINIRTLELSGFEKLYLGLRKRVIKFRRHLLSDDSEKRIHWAYSIEKAKKNFGYSPKVSLKEGIAKTLSQPFPSILSPLSGEGRVRSKERGNLVY